MNKLIFGIILTSHLAGCAGNQSTSYYGYYTVDLEHNNFCDGPDNTGVLCYPLEMIELSFHEHDIARAYQIKPKSMIWSTDDFVEVLLRPESQLYSAEQRSDTVYQIPKNHASETAYRYIKHEYYMLYETNKRRI